MALLFFNNVGIVFNTNIAQPVAIEAWVSRKLVSVYPYMFILYISGDVVFPILYEIMTKTKGILTNF